MKLIVWDLDGTLIDMEHRVKYLKRTPKDWVNHRKNYHLDTIIKNVAFLYKMVSAYKEDHLIVRIFLTARAESERAATEEWLLDHNLHAHKLVMRPIDDHSEDADLKERMLHKWIEEGHEILFVVEDRKAVVDMWRRNGITCLQCAPGDF